MTLVLSLLIGAAQANPVAAERGSGGRPIQRPPVVVVPPHPSGDPLCDQAETVLNGYLPRTATVASNSAYKAKLTISAGNVLDCNLANGSFEIRFAVSLKQYAKVPLVGWKKIASTSGSVRVSFTLVSISSSQIKLTNLQVLGVNLNNVPNWFDDGIVKDALNAIFPRTITISL
jgi:hypothetical protein